MQKTMKARKTNGEVSKCKESLQNPNICSNKHLSPRTSFPQLNTRLANVTSTKLPEINSNHAYMATGRKHQSLLCPEMSRDNGSQETDSTTSLKRHSLNIPKLGEIRGLAHRESDQERKAEEHPPKM